jgi:hypothetical protein
VTVIRAMAKAMRAMATVMAMATAKRWAMATSMRLAGKE